MQQAHPLSNLGASSSLNSGHSSSSLTPPLHHMLGSSSQFSNSSGMNLMQSHYVAGKNPGAYALGSGDDGGGGGGGDGGGGYVGSNPYAPNYQQQQHLQHPSDDMQQPTMQTGIATMMTSHGNGGFTDFMHQPGQPGNNMISDSDDEDLFSVSL